MSGTQQKKSDLIEKSLEKGRALGMATLIFHQGIAERLGLNGTDHKCVDILLRTGPITAGELSEITGLTTGAITGVIDRLETANLVRREHDPNDRRRVIVRPLPDPKRGKEMAALFTGLQKSMLELASGYTAKELEVIVDFMTKSVDVFAQETSI